MMREWEFTLDEPVDGIDRLFFYAPSYGTGRKFAVKVERGMVDASTKARQVSAGSKGKADGDDADGDSPKTDWKEGTTDIEVASMFSISDHYEDLLESFVQSCSGSNMCKANGGSVPRSFFDKMDFATLKALFGGYVKRFLL